MADFTISYIDSGISTVVPIEDNSKENAWNFMKPLTKELWFTIAGFFILTGFVVWALEHGVNEEFRGQPHKQIGMIFWFAFSTLVFAHKEKVKRNLSRFVLIIWLFVVLVLTSSYIANLTSMLTERDKAFMFELNVAPRNKHKPWSIWPLPTFTFIGSDPPFLH